MANQQTAQDWATVKNEAQKEIDSIGPLLRTATVRLKDANDRFNTLSFTENQLKDDPNKVAEYEAARNARINYYRDFLKPAQNAEQALRDDLNAAQRDYNYASEQLVIASSGPPNTNLNTPPANIGPGNPNALTNPNTETIQNDSAILDANQEPQTFQDLINAERQAEFIATNEAPAVDNDPAYNSSFADDAAASAAAAPVNSDLYGYEYDGAAPYATSNTRGIQGQITSAISQASYQDSVNFGNRQDWRVRLVLAKNADYLYNAKPAGILEPLIATKGIVFPYTPIIAVTYSANYDQQPLTHNNYKVVQYQSSSVDNVQITCDFTAQDTFEANYVLAVIHFLRSATKMFYGQDEKPKLGTPPPLLYLKGYGAFQFDNHPLVIQSFTYNLPNDIDYIRASSTTTLAGVSKDTNTTATSTTGTNRQLPQGVAPGGGTTPTVFSNPASGTIEPTYVPTKLQIQLTCIPVTSRKDISDRFSFKDYATGKLLRGSQTSNAGIW